MDDLISRQAAIDAPDEEQSLGIQDILEYMDTVLHPIISPDHWSVYSELHDMISMLPSAQPDGKIMLDKEAILQAGYQGREVDFRIGGRLFAIREKAQ